MAKTKTFTLFGEAAGEYARAQAGQVARTDADRALRIASMVSVQMQLGDEVTASLLIVLTANKGLAYVADNVCTLKKGSSSSVPRREAFDPADDAPRLVCSHSKTEPCRPCGRERCALCELASGCSCQKKGKKP